MHSCAEYASEKCTPLTEKDQTGGRIGIKEGSFVELLWYSRKPGEGYEWGSWEKSWSKILKAKYKLR